MCHFFHQSCYYNAITRYFIAQLTDRKYMYKIIIAETRNGIEKLNAIKDQTAFSGREIISTQEESERPEIRAIRWSWLDAPSRINAGRQAGRQGRQSSTMLPGNQTARLLSADRPGCAEDHARAPDEGNEGHRGVAEGPRGRGGSSDGVGLVAKGAGGRQLARGPQARHTMRAARRWKKVQRGVSRSRMREKLAGITNPSENARKEK